MLIDEIKEYYEKRQLNHPNVWEALGWTITEIGEVYEVLLSQGSWVRNNPENKPKFSKEALAEELGVVIFMLVVAGIESGVDPIQALRDKMQRKISQKLATGTSTLEEVKPEEVEMFITDNHGAFEDYGRKGE